jgi:hypothetical protein
MLPIRVIAGDVPVATPLILSTYGGEVVRDGVTVRAENHDYEPLKEGVVYLIFLTRFGQEPGVYQMYNAGVFERVNNGARPLARQGKDLYKDFSRTYGDVVNRVRESARAR